MKLYQILAQYYDQLFPVRETTLDFLSGFLIPGKTVLDVGCGTGGYTCALTERGTDCIGIDPDSEMIRKAEEKNRERTVLFQQLGMEDVGSFTRKFGTIMCIGNTLVHLPDYDGVGRFFSDCRSLLVPQGKAVFQIVNYDRVYEEVNPTLPDISAENVIMKRSYTPAENPGKILFTVQIIVRSRGEEKMYEAVHPLLALHSEEIRSLSESAGFSSINFYGNFNKAPFTKKSSACIALAAQ